MTRPVDVNPTRLSIRNVLDGVRSTHNYVVPPQVLGVLTGALVGAKLIDDLADVVDDADDFAPELYRYSPMVVGILADVWFRTANNLLFQGSFNQGLKSAVETVVKDLELAKFEGWPTAQ